MRKIIQLLSVMAVVSLLFSCGGGMSGYFMKYTDKDGKEVSFSAPELTYTFVNGVYINGFGGSPSKNVQFKLVDGYSFEAEGMVGKEIEVMIFESDKTIIWGAEEFVPEKSFKCKVETFEFVREGMMEDKVYKLTGKFDADGFKGGEYALQVNI